VTQQERSDYLRKEVIRLAPWHLDIEITPDLSTAAFLDAALTAEQSRSSVSFLRPHEPWCALITSIYPNGLLGRTVLDCACNCGGYSLWMRELGGSGGLAFDVRETWIEQARFLQANRTRPSDGIRFEVAELGDLLTETDETFDVAIFKGIFYHLPDPIHSLRLVAAHTRELLIVNTAARLDLPDGMLVATRESVTEPMSGVHGLAWLPTGPKVIAEILESVGFPATRVTLRLPGDEFEANLARIELIASRDQSVFQDFDRSPPPWIPGAAPGTEPAAGPPTEA
jgi:2-polyprenyl-3-methyl-5-hydroxy-6-metoxy-1,4-benzoquinol methylase